MHKAAILLQGLLADSKDALGMKPRKSDVKGERMLVRNAYKSALVYMLSVSNLGTL